MSNSFKQHLETLLTQVIASCKGKAGVGLTPETAEIGVLDWAAEIKYCGLGGLTNKNSFLAVQEPGSLRSGCQQGLFLVGMLILAHGWLPSCPVLTWWRERAPVSLRPLKRVLIPV